MGVHRAAISNALAKAGHEDLPPRAMWAIDALAQSERTAGGLAALLGVSKQAMSLLVESLVSRGYVERAADATDRRRITLRLTRSGRAVATTIAGATAGVEATALEQVGAAALEQARATIAAIAALDQR
jgi:DNA-binding MarR family transcriptional regulator